MKKVVLSLIGIILISFGVGLFFIMSNYSNILNKSTFEINESKNITNNELKSIKIDNSHTGVGADINIIPEDRKDVKVSLSGRLSSSKESQKPRIEVSENGSELNIKINYNSPSFHIGFFSSNLELKVYVPKQNYELIYAATSSGDIQANDLNIKDMDLKTTSGDLIIKNIFAESVDFGTTSGTIKANKLETNTAKVFCTSGDIKLDKFSGDLEGGCTSGDIEVNYEKFTNNVNINMTSGDVLLEIPKEANFYLNASVTSGDIKCKHSIDIIRSEHRHLEGTAGSDENKINISATSGDIDVE